MSRSDSPKITSPMVRYLSRIDRMDVIGLDVLQIIASQPHMPKALCRNPGATMLIRGPQINAAWLAPLTPFPTPEARSDGSQRHDGMSTCSFG